MMETAPSRLSPPRCTQPFSHSFILISQLLEWVFILIKCATCRDGWGPGCCDCQQSSFVQRQILCHLNISIFSSFIIDEVGSHFNEIACKLWKPQHTMKISRTANRNRGHKHHHPTRETDVENKESLKFSGKIPCWNVRTLRRGVPWSSSTSCSSLGDSLTPNTYL